MLTKKQEAAQAKAQDEADKWNAEHPDDTDVILTDDDGVEHSTYTRSIAWELCGHAVIKVKGRAGGYLLERIRPVVVKDA